MISLAESKINLNIDNSNTDYDDILNILISVVEKEIVEMLGQEIETTTKELVFDGNGTSLQLLKQFPIQSISKLEYISDLILPWTSATEIDDSYYVLVDTNGITSIYYENYFKIGYKYRATFVYGYDTIPKTVKQIAFEMLNIYFKETDIREGMKGGRLGVSSISESAGGVSINTVFEKNKRNNWFQRLRPYAGVL